METKRFAEIHNADLGVLFICSIRYSIGRNTYMPQLICRIVKEHIDSLLPSDRIMLAENIESELNRLEFFHKKDPESLDTKIKLEEKAKWTQLIEALRGQGQDNGQAV